MTTEEAIRRIKSAPDYTEVAVKEAVRECLQGKHGAFPHHFLLALGKATGAIDDNSNP